MPASSISTLGAITSPWPASWRWAITTAPRDCRGIGSLGSRPFGAKASQPRRTVDITRLATWLTIFAVVLTRNQRFESISLQLRVCKPSVPPEISERDPHVRRPGRPPHRPTTITNALSLYRNNHSPVWRPPTATHVG